MVFIVEVCVWNPVGLVSKVYHKLPTENYLSTYEDILNTYSTSGYHLDFIYDLEDAMSQKDINYSYPVCVGKYDELTINISLIYNPYE
jgi:hypothetical protein